MIMFTKKKINLKFSFLQSKSKPAEVPDNKNIQHENADLFLDQPLDTGFDVFCDNSVYKVSFTDFQTF